MYIMDMINTMNMLYKSDRQCPKSLKESRGKLLNSL
jgi:hypothetical protein